MEETGKKNLKLDDDLVQQIESSKQAEEIQEESQDKPQEKPNTKHRKNLIWIPITIAGIVLAAAAGFYVTKAFSYKEKYLPGTYINGIDVSDKTPEEFKSLIGSSYDDYVIRIDSRGREPEEIHAADISMKAVTGDEPERILMNQNIWSWPLEYNNRKEHSVPTDIEIDETRFSSVCSGLKAFDDTTASAPVNAELGDYDSSLNAYAVISEQDGNVITDKGRAVEMIRNSIMNREPGIDLEDEADSIYSSAEIRSDNTVLLSEKNKLDRFVKPKISYPAYDIVLDGNTLKDWIVQNPDGSLKYDEDKIRAFVTVIADTFDTLGKERKLVTQYGNETVVGGGDFGWEVDQEAEFEELKSLLSRGDSMEREPVFSSRGISFGDNDWGDTYVEVNLHRQHLYFVKEGKLIVSSDLVSGGLQRKAPTPTGVYSVKYKARNAVLRGPRRRDGSYEWESPVSYWMPFNKGIGLHDAKWRGSFGGNIYKTNGSHGCVNLPLRKAKGIFEEISTGIPVIVYDDDFEPLNIPLDPEEEQKRQEEERKAEQKKMEEFAKKAQKVPEVKKDTKKTVPEPAPAPAPQAVPETVPEIVPETETQTQAQTAPEEWGPAFDSSANSAGAATDIIPLEPEVTTDVENLPGDM